MIKIIKIYYSCLFSFRKLHIDSSPFHTSRCVDQLISDVEILYTDTFESGNRARAMKRLRVPPLEEKQSPAVTFRVGFFVGTFCFFFCFFFFFWKTKRKSTLYFS